MSTRSPRRLFATLSAIALGLPAVLVATSTPASAAAACPAGSTAVPSSSPLICQVTISWTPPSGTWTVPDGVTSVDVVVIGGGGGGNTSAAGSAPGGGGGAGAQITAQTVVVTPLSAVNVTVGSGGGGGFDGGSFRAGMAGQSSIFGSVTALGGAGGGGTTTTGNTSGSGTYAGGVAGGNVGGGGAGAGGAGVGGAFGGTGGAGFAPTYGLFAGNTTKYAGGGGGGAYSGSPGAGTDGGGNGGDPDVPIPGSPGMTYGSGGGGGVGVLVGGPGANGVVLIRFRQLPLAPTNLVATPQDGKASIAFTPAVDGTSAVTNYEYSLDGTSWTPFSPLVTSGPVEIPGLTNGTSYSVRLRAVSALGEGSAATVSVVPGFVPSAPTALVATPGDASASIAFTAGAAGTMPIDNYEYSTDGGTSWTTLSPAVTTSPVSVTGLTNGTAYSIQLRAVSAVGPSSASTAVSVTPVAPPTPRPPRPVPTPTPTPSPTPTPVPVPPLAPGGSVVTVDGKPQQVTSGPNAQGDAVDISGEGFAVQMQGLDGEGKPLAVGPDGALVLRDDRGVRTAGSGFQSSSQVDFYLDPPSLVTSRAAGADAGITLGTATTDASGAFASTVTLPADVSVGDHVLQVVGVTPTGGLRAISLGVRVSPDASITLVKGVRTDAEAHDRITATGSVSDLPAGTVLTPYVRLEGRPSFVAGVARIVVQADGSFRWSRLVRSDREVTAYVAWTDVKSDEVTWLKLR